MPTASRNWSPADIERLADASGLWRKLDPSGHLPIFLRSGGPVFYAREYLTHGGDSACAANQLIHDFKKPVSRRGELDWPLKAAAISQFALELALLLGYGAVVAAIPTSKSREDPDFDSRLDDTLAELQRLRPGVLVETPFAVRETLVPAHRGGTRHPRRLYANLDWLGFTHPTDHLVLIDDVLTTGSHFAACKRLILDHHPDVAFFGLFWCMAV